MHYDKVDSPAIADASAAEATGMTLVQWYEILDGIGGPSAGRKALAEHLLQRKVDPWWATTIAVEYEIARGAKEKDGLPPGYAICVTKTVAAKAADVFAAFGDPKRAAVWFGSGAKLALSDGGAYENADGDRGTFTRVRKDKDVRLTWEQPRHAAGSKVEIAFQDKAGKCGIVLKHERIQRRRDADELRVAWGAALDRLKALVEKG